MKKMIRAFALCLLPFALASAALAAVATGPSGIGNVNVAYITNLTVNTTVINQATVTNLTVITNLTVNTTVVTNITVVQNSIFNGKVTINTNTYITNYSTIYISGDPVMTTASTNTFTNKTLDAADTGNVVKLTGYIQLVHPHRSDQAGAVMSTSDPSLAYYGHALFSGSAATNVNWIEYRCVVPEDIDTAVDLKARWKVRLAAADTAASTYTIGMASVADSASHDSPTLGQYVTLSVGADASGASGDVETVSAVTLTSWKSNVTAGQLWVIRVARDGSDTSTQAHYDAGLVLQYGITQ